MRIMRNGLRCKRRNIQMYITVRTGKGAKKNRALKPGFIDCYGKIIDFFFLIGFWESPDFSAVPVWPAGHLPSVSSIWIWELWKDWPCKTRSWPAVFSHQ